MTARTWTYSKLITFPGLIALIGGEASPRVFAKKSMTSAIEEHPYVVYKLGNNTNEDLSEEEDLSRQFLQIFVHDYSDGEVADYAKIDQVIEQIKLAMKLPESTVDGIMSAKYLETSQDLNDETLNTVMKYIRFQLIVKEN